MRIRTRWMEILLCSATLFLAPAVPVNATPQDTTLTYQGRLIEEALPVTGYRDFQFALYDAETGGSQVGSTITFDTTNRVSVHDGLFTVRLNFTGAFTGNRRWIEIRSKRPEDSTYATLTPRQPITAVPYSSHALNAAHAATADAADTADVAYTWDGGDVSDAESAREALELGNLAQLDTVDDSKWTTGGAPLSILNGGTGAATQAAARAALGAVAKSGGDTIYGNYTLYGALTSQGTLTSYGTVTGNAFSTSGTVTATGALTAGSITTGGLTKTMSLKVNSPRSAGSDVACGISQTLAERSVNALTRSSTSNGYEIGIGTTTAGATVSVSYPLQFVPGTTIQKFEIYVDASTGAVVDLFVARHRRTADTPTSVALDYSLTTSSTVPSGTGVHVVKLEWTPGTAITVQDRESLYLIVRLTTDASEEAYVSNVSAILGERVY